MRFKYSRGTNEYEIEFKQGQTIHEAIRSWGGLSFSAPCGGNGSCGKCLVNVDGREVLACQTLAHDGMNVSVLPGSVYDGDNGVEVKVQLVEENAGAGSGVGEGPFPENIGIAVDIGTTTIAVAAVDLAGGSVIKTAGALNPQSSFGADVISRIKAAGEGHLKKMQSQVVETVSGLISQALQGLTGLETENFNNKAAENLAEISRIYKKIRRMAVAGNPTMCHIFAGLSPEGLGRAPFEMASNFGNARNAVELGFGFDCDVYILPSASAFVGGDVMGGVIACGMDNFDIRSQAGSSESTLFVDVGTNGEMVLAGPDGAKCCATAAGPVFEGAQIECGMVAGPGAISAVWLEGGKLKIQTIGHAKPVGISGSGLIDAIAVMLDVEAIDETGKMTGDKFYLADGVYITQKDVRNFQMAKGAIKAGIKMLCGETVPENLLLAGGFGSFIREESAIRTGLIPAEFAGKIKAVGNTALLGAIECLKSESAKTSTESICRNINYVDLSGNAEFADLYVDNMNFPGLSL